MDLEEIKKMDLVELKKRKASELWAITKETREKLFRAKMDLKTGQSNKNQDPKKLKRQLARMLTVLREEQHTVVK